MVWAAHVTICLVCINSWPEFPLWLNASVFFLGFLLDGTCQLSGFSFRVCRCDMGWTQGRHIHSVESSGVLDIVYFPLWRIPLSFLFPSVSWCYRLHPFYTQTCCSLRLPHPPLEDPSAGSLLCLACSYILSRKNSQSGGSECGMGRP